MLDQTTMRNSIEELIATDSGISAAAIVSYDGLIMVSSMSERDRSDTFAAITSEVLSKAKLAVEELDYGEVHCQLVLGETGGLIVRVINEEMVLAVEVNKSVNVGAAVRGANRTAQRLSANY